MTGAGEITNGNLTLLANLIAQLTGAGEVEPPPTLLGTLYMFSNQLTGAGMVAATLTAYASIQADLAGAGSLAAIKYATGELGARITGESILSPQNLAAAVWSALAAQYNADGTMGEKLNAAGAGNIDYAALAAAMLAQIEASDVLAKEATAQAILGLSV